MVKVPNIILPSVVGILTYILVSKFFPEKVIKDLKYGDTVRDHLIKKIVKKMMNDRALKITLIAAFSTAGFHETLLLMLK